MRIILSRTDSIGDVVLTLPMAGVLKHYFPDCRIIFLGKNYTRSVIEASAFVDEFLAWDEADDILHPSLSGRQATSQISIIKSLKADIIIHVFPVPAICKLARQAGIPQRIATAGRFYTWFNCNRLRWIPRKNSSLHEAQLNLKLLKPLGITREFTRDEIPEFYGLTNPLKHSLFSSPISSKFNLILHPKSKGSAREWGLDNFSKLISLLPQNKFNIYISGTREEGDRMQDFLMRNQSRITDLTGKHNLSEFMGFIRSCDGMVAASTGPLHLAAALGKHVIGLYAPMRPIFPQRWAPLGKHARYLVLDKNCQDCRQTLDCQCIRSISPEDVAEILFSLLPG